MTLNDLLGIATVFGVLILFYCIMVGLGSVLKPLRNAAENRKAPIQFTLADLLSLFVPIQLQLGIYHWVMLYRKTGASSWVSDLLIVVLGVALWWFLVRQLSRAGVDVVWHRCVMLVAVPSIVSAAAVMTSPSSVIEDLLDHHPILAMLGLLLTAALSAGALYALGRFTRSIIASAEARRGESSPGNKQNEPH
jgi:hypothetical protein